MTSTQPRLNADIFAPSRIHDDDQAAPTQHPFKLFGQLIIPGVPNNFLNQETLVIQEYVVESPMPLRWFCPEDGRFGSFSNSFPESSDTQKSRKRKRKDDIVDKKEKKKASSIESHVSEPPPTLDQIPQLLQMVESHNGKTPVFLYQKRLQESDTKSSQNRLFVNETEKLMEFLREEERRAVMEEKKSVAIDAFDPQDTLYKLKISKWGNRVVVNGKWFKLIKSNRAETGDIVQLWGFRYRATDNMEEEGNNLGFIFHFKNGQADI